MKLSRGFYLLLSGGIVALLLVMLALDPELWVSVKIEYLPHFLIALTPILWVCFTLWRHRAYLSRVQPSLGTGLGLSISGIALAVSSFFTVGITLDFFRGTHIGSLADIVLGVVVVLAFFAQIISASTLNVIISRVYREN